MNEFTKEELEDIVHLINDVHTGSQKHGLEWGFDLRDKIQSLIDNYCEYQCLLCRGFKCKPGICLIENRTYNENE